VDVEVGEAVLDVAVVISDVVVVVAEVKLICKKKFHPIIDFRRW
jgi:hypothetical protein